jgi:hypothetical protein
MNQHGFTPEMKRVATYQWTFNKSALDEGETIFDARERDLRDNVTSLHFGDVELDIS